MAYKERKTKRFFSGEQKTLYKVNFDRKYKLK